MIGTDDRRQRSAGFTLVELLTVIAIVGILATLLLSVLATAKKKGRIAVCTSNLRQSVLAYEMYRSDFPKRPSDLAQLVVSRHLSDDKVLLCPEDRTKKWGQLVQPIRLAGENTVPYSYLHPMPWSDSDWNLLERAGSSAGLLVCQLHGLGRQRPDLPSVRDFEGLVLRGQLDGAVVRRQMYWEDPVLKVADSAESSFAASPQFATTRLGGGRLPWRFFVDLPPGQDQPKP